MTNATELIEEVRGNIETMVVKRLHEDTRDFLYVPNDDEIKELITLIKDHYLEVLVEAIADIHPYASGSNESTSMQEKAIETINEVMK